MNDDRRSMESMVSEYYSGGSADQRFASLFFEIARRLDKLFVAKPTYIQEEARKLRDRINGPEFTTASFCGERIDWSDPDHALVAGYHFAKHGEQK